MIHHTYLAPPVGLGLSTTQEASILRLCGHIHRTICSNNLEGILPDSAVDALSKVGREAVARRFLDLLTHKGMSEGELAIYHADVMADFLVDKDMAREFKSAGIHVVLATRAWAGLIPDASEDSDDRINPEDFVKILAR